MSSTEEHSTAVVPNKTKFPAEPCEYKPETKFIHKKRDLELTGEIIRDVITNGVIRHINNYTAKFVKRVAGFTWEFVVEFNSDYENDLVNVRRFK